MKNKILILASALFLSVTGAFAQKYTEGDKSLSFLAGETSFCIKFDYTDMLVGKMPEADYIEKKKAEYNAKQKGKGEKWEKNWLDARDNRYEPKFEDLFNKYLQEISGSCSQEDTTAKYTLIVRTVMTEPGFNAVAMKRVPFCNYQITWVETATGTVMAKGILNNVQGVIFGGSDFDFDPTNGIVECYAKAGKMMAKKIVKAMKAKKKK